MLFVVTFDLKTRTLFELRARTLTKGKANNSLSIIATGMSYTRMYQTHSVPLCLRDFGHMDTIQK